MAISVQVPKDLSGIKTKVALNLTKRQIICFSGAAVAGIPLYFLTKGLIGTSAASLLMMGAMLEFGWNYPACGILHCFAALPRGACKTRVPGW